jgi:hypothetical protein
MNLAWSSAWPASVDRARRAVGRVAGSRTSLVYSCSAETTFGTEGLTTGRYRNRVPVRSPMWQDRGRSRGLMPGAVLGFVTGAITGSPGLWTDVCDPNNTACIHCDALSGR